MTEQTGTISYPTPIFQNLPIQAQFYKPSRYQISDISTGLTTLVTTTEDHNYVIGQEVRLVIPPPYGIRQLNGQSGVIISIPQDDQFVLNISSQFVDPFINASDELQVAQVTAIGDFNMGQTNINGRNNQKTFIPGSFQNISPQ